MSELVRLRGMIVGLLVLHESEPNVQRADVEDDGDGDVEETEQHHQLTGPVEKVEVDGGVCCHVRGWVCWVCWGRKLRRGPGLRLTVSCCAPTPF